MVAAEDAAAVVEAGGAGAGGGDRRGGHSGGQTTMAAFARQRRMSGAVPMVLRRHAAGRAVRNGPAAAGLQVPFSLHDSSPVIESQYRINTCSSPLKI